MELRIDQLTPNPFLSSPGDLLAATVADLIAAVPQFAKLFGIGGGRNIDGYLRADYGIRNLPALRIYQMEPETMENDNWFIVGHLELDVILPPSLRREELHIASDVICGGLLQQFRRTDFFMAARAIVPGLNWLGQSMTISKNRAFMLNDDEQIPMCVVTSDFRLDLREWDLYLESDDRTVGTPFQRTLANLTVIAAHIQAQNDNGTDAGVDIESDSNV